MHACGRNAALTRDASQYHTSGHSCMEHQPGLEKSHESPVCVCACLCKHACLHAQGKGPGKHFSYMGLFSPQVKQMGKKGTITISPTFFLLHGSERWCWNTKKWDSQVEQINWSTIPTSDRRLNALQNKLDMLTTSLKPTLATGFEMWRTILCDHVMVNAALQNMLNTLATGFEMWRTIMCDHVMVNAALQNMLNTLATGFEMWCTIMCDHVMVNAALQNMLNTLAIGFEMWRTMMWPWDGEHCLTEQAEHTGKNPGSLQTLISDTEQCVTV